MGKAVTEADIMVALDASHPPPAWAFIPQVRDGTGIGAGRTADAVAMSLWPSRGLEVTGYEVKVSRADWLRELRNPEKAETIFGYCDRWYVATPEGVVAPGELPPTWGHKAFRGGRIDTEVEAPKLIPAALDRIFVASLMRRLHGLRADRREIDKAVVVALDERRTTDQRALDRLKQAVAAFEKASGVHMVEWNAGEIGDAVRWVLNGGILGIRLELNDIRKRAERVIAAVGEAGPGGG